MKLLNVLLALTVVGALAGCAHPINVKPDLNAIERLPISSSYTSASVGYYIPTNLLSLEVTTPGGGGDNVRYYPYRDIEAGYERALSSVFPGLVKLPSTFDYLRAKQFGLDYVIEPQIVTNSGSTGFFTWPPTNFTVDLTSHIHDANGQLIAAPRVLGVGTAETGERLREHGLAGKRAMNDALSKMQASLLALKLGSTSVSQSSGRQASSLHSDAASRLQYLKELMDQGLLTPSEYSAKRKEVLDLL